MAPASRSADLTLDDFEWSAFDPTDGFPDLADSDGGQRTTLSPAADDFEDIQTVSSRSPSQTPPGGDRLPLLQLSDWDENGLYDEQPPTCVHYSIEWKLTANKKLVARDSEPDLVLAPNAYWTRTLRHKLDRLVTKKLPSNKSFKIDDTDVVVSVRDRTQHDLVKRFDDLDIDWNVVERQMKNWSHLHRAGRAITIKISFNYMENGPSSTAKRGTKRGFSSITQDRLQERAVLLDAEESSTGQPSTWQRVYSLMRCPGSPCDLGPHCWRDGVGKRHYKLKSHHLRALIRHVEQGGALENHNDVPDEVRDQLYAEEQQEEERHRKAKAKTSPFGNCPPINITNVMPASSPPSSAEVAMTPRSESNIRCQVVLPLHATGSRDVAMRKYCDWQCSQVQCETLKQEFQRAFDVALGDGFDLEQIHEDQNSEFFIEQGIKIGVAKRFVRDIRTWAEQFSSMS
ncbi:hypothetical protein CI238_10898 [Colletotrichum incanum]|uniref:Uncharacterized protein n=1 Tax=Colletotrichum incanum TaxID=1573173 RepID=A0A162NBF9_COLIC|nr:hypothetical protein CI238_10898 [Colletotrichum incanum]